MLGTDGLISERCAWRGSAIGGKEGLVLEFTPTQIETMHALMQSSRQLPIEAITREMFDAPEITPFLATVADELATGRGCAILRGLSRERHSDEELTRIYWGIGTHLGVARPQKGDGRKLDHIRDTPEDNPLGQRQYNTDELVFHTDDVIGQNLGLLSLCKSKSGGVSKLVSALSIHNQLARNHPDHLAALYEGFFYHRKGKQRAGDPLISPYPVPVYSCIDGLVTVQYIRDYMAKASPLVPGGMPALFHEALDYFDSYANDPSMNVTFMLEPGEIELLNNRVVLHSRTQFEDYPEPDRKRHLVRLWMDVPNGRPYKPEMHYLGQEELIGARAHA